MEGTVPVERRIVTVLFADLVGFTPLSESLDPEDVASVQDAYFAVVRETVARYGGQLEKFIGDAAMAVFGIPRGREDDAERAVRAGLSLNAAIEVLGARLGLDVGQLRLRVGVNTGDVVHAESGPDRGRVTGDTVNVAARLQTAAQPGTVLLGEQTALAVAGSVELGAVESIELKGKAAPVRATVALALLDEPSRERAMGSLRAPMIGREADLAWFGTEVAGVAAGTSRAMLVSAPPGVGKSRFVAEASRSAVDDGIVSAVWRARLRADSGAFEAIGELLGDAMGLERDATPDRAAIEARLAAGSDLTPARASIVADALASVAGTAVMPDVRAPAGDGGEAERVTAWLDGLDALAGGSTVLWVVEDLHWASPDLLAFLAEASRRPIRGGGRRIVLATTRPTSAPAGVLEGAVQRDLATLAPTDTAQLIRRLVGDGLPPSLVERIADRSDGNALFVEELFRTWVAVGALVRTDSGEWRLTVDSADVTVPTTVQSIYAVQIDDLPAAARMVVRHGAVSGRRFPSDVLPSLDVADPRPPVRSLVASAVISGPSSDAIVGDVFTFRHALLRDAGYASLSRAERARLHVAVARWLESVSGDRSIDVAEAIGGHYAAALAATPALATNVADGLDRETTAELAAEWLDRAGQRVMQLSALRTAQELFERSVALTPIDHLMTVAHRLMHLGEAMSAGGNKDDAVEALERAREAFAHGMDDDADPSQRAAARDGLAHATRLLGEAWHEQLRFRDGQHLAAATLHEIGGGHPGVPDLARASLLILGARAEHAETDADTSQSVEEALAIARDAGDRKLELEAMRELFIIRTELGLPDTDGWEARESVARELGDWQALQSSLQNRAMSVSDDQPTAALALIDEAATVAEAHGAAEALAWADYGRAEALTVMGDLGAAIAACERALHIAEMHGYRRAAVRTYHLLVPLAEELGDHGPARRLAAFYAAQESAFPDSPYSRVMRAAMNLWIADAGLAAPFVPEVEPRLASFDGPQSSASWLLAVERVVGTWLDAGELGGATEAIARMEAFRDHPDTTDLGRASIDILAARLAIADGRRPDAVRLATRARGLAGSIPAPLWAARAEAVLTLVGGADR